MNESNADEEAQEWMKHGLADTAAIEAMERVFHELGALKIVDPHWTGLRPPK